MITCDGSVDGDGKRETSMQGRAGLVIERTKVIMLFKTGGVLGLSGIGLYWLIHQVKKRSAEAHSGCCI